MPINSNELFLKAFKGYEDYYVLIGGTATSIILNTNGLGSRTTKDYDMVIIEDKKNKMFFDILVKFLKDGQYSPERLDEKGHLFRFITSNEAYPKMIELFCVTPNWPLKRFGRKAPVHFDEDMSLSALLLDEEYYNLLCNGKEIVDGYSVLNNVTLIIFKAKAWLDLSFRKEMGENVSTNNIKKHLNDIARLTGTLTGEEQIELSAVIRNDMDSFLNKLNDNLDLIPSNDDIVLNKDEIADILHHLLKIKEESLF